MRVKMPALGCDGLPKENGTTRRDANGGLLYLNPVTGQYVCKVDMFLRECLC